MELFRSAMVSRPDADDQEADTGSIVDDGRRLDVWDAVVAALGSSGEGGHSRAVTVEALLRSEGIVEARAYLELTEQGRGMLMAELRKGGLTCVQVSRLQNALTRAAGGLGPQPRRGSGRLNRTPLRMAWPHMEILYRAVSISPLDLLVPYGYQVPPIARPAVQPPTVAGDTAT